MYTNLYYMCPTMDCTCYSYIMQFFAPFWRTQATHAGVEQVRADVLQYNAPLLVLFENGYQNKSSFQLNERL